MLDGMRKGSSMPVGMQTCRCGCRCCCCSGVCMHAVLCCAVSHYSVPRCYYSRLPAHPALPCCRLILSSQPHPHQRAAAHRPAGRHVCPGLAGAAQRTLPAGPVLSCHGSEAAARGGGSERLCAAVPRAVAAAAPNQLCAVCTRMCRGPRSAPNCSHFQVQACFTLHLSTCTAQAACSTGPPASKPSAILYMSSALMALQHHLALLPPCPIDALSCLAVHLCRASP